MLDDESEDGIDDPLLQAVAWTPVVTPFTGTDRYRVRSCLGEGGFGVVYEVEDRDTGRRIALKTLKSQRSGFAANIARLKREFRSVADLVHPNLVGLHELASHESRWFFTMELVRGRTFREYVRDCSETQVRAAIGQLVAGVTALHAAGITHRDLKPSNVLVEPGGRVVILDFGLANTDDDPDLSDAGTPIYMAPERHASPAADWYSVGVMLHEALTGALPGAKALAAMPADLERLCRGLMRENPRERPTADQICALLGQAPPVAVRRDLPFIGRTREIEILRQAYERRALVRIEGQPGVGKTALLERFREELRDAVVLAGRCHEREAVSFKAFDGVIEQLVDYLKSLPRHEAAALMPRDIALVAQLFPALDGVTAIHDVPRRVAPADLHEVREMSFAALRELLARVADKVPLVIVIDDLQWSDIDSARLLVHLLAPPRPRLLLALAHRNDERSPALHETLRMLDATHERAVQLTVSPLPARDAEELAVALLGSRASAREIAERGEGHPLFITELARAAAKQGASDAPSLLDMLWQRVQQLSVGARALVETLAVAGAPLPPRLCCAVAGVDDGSTAVRVLRAEHLIRAGERGELDVFHDRIRDAVITRVDVGTRKLRHLALARSLEAAADADPETVAHHYDAAGEHVPAARYALLAADNAMKSLAFDRAAALYRIAIAHSPDGGSTDLHERLGDALLAARYDAAAGRAYLEAADRTSGGRATRLRARAGKHMLEVGDVAAGYAALERALADIGERLPANADASMREAFRHVLVMRLRGWRHRERDAASISSDTLLHLDVLDAAIMGVASADFARAIGVAMRFARRSLAAGSPRHVALALAWASMSFAGAVRPAKIDELLDRAEAIATRIEDWSAVALTMRLRAQALISYGDARGSRTACLATASLISERCVDLGESQRAMRAVAALEALLLGEVEHAKREADALLVAATETEDPIAARLVCAAVLTPIALAGDDVERAQQYNDHLATEDRCATVAFGADAAVSLAMYRGRASEAVELMRRRTAAIEREGLLGTPIFRLIYVRSYVSALCAAGEPTREATRLLRSIRRYRFPLARAMQLNLRGLVELARDKHARATALLRDAARLYDEVGFVLHAAACKYRAAELASDDAATARARSTLRALGVVDPDRWTAMMVPRVPSHRRGSLRGAPTPEAAA